MVEEIDIYFQQTYGDQHNPWPSSLTMEHAMDGLGTNISRESNFEEIYENETTPVILANLGSIASYRGKRCKKGPGLCPPINIASTLVLQEGPPLVQALWLLTLMRVIFRVSYSNNQDFKKMTCFWPTWSLKVWDEDWPTLIWWMVECWIALWLGKKM